MKAEGTISKMALRHGTWLAVCDSSRALLLENKGDRLYPKLEIRGSTASSIPLAHELGTAKPGRAFSGIDGQRSAVEETDFHLQAEQQFLRDFANSIEQKVDEANVPALILIAPARALGFLRECLGARTCQVLAGSLARDYVHLPLYEIERHLTELQPNE
jgi:protein required for attachment to host cells